MPGSGLLTFSGILVGFPTGSRTFSETYNITAAIDDSLELTLVAGDNTILVPSGANGVMITPPLSNTVSLRVMGPGDTVGLAIHPIFGMIYFIDDVVQTSFVLNAASLLTAPVQLTFF